MSPNSKKTRTVIEIPVDVLDHLRAIRSESGIPASETIRRAISAYLAEHHGYPTQPEISPEAREIIRRAVKSISVPTLFSSVYRASAVDPKTRTFIDFEVIDAGQSVAYEVSLRGEMETYSLESILPASEFARVKKLLAKAVRASK